MFKQIVMVFEYIFLGAFRHYNLRLHESPFVAALGGGGIIVSLVSANIISLVAFTAQRGSDNYSEQFIKMVVGLGGWTLAPFWLLAAYLVSNRLGSAARREQIKTKIAALSRIEQSRLRLASYLYAMTTIVLLVASVHYRG